MILSNLITVSLPFSFNLILSISDAFVNSPEWTLSRNVPDIRLVSVLKFNTESHHPCSGELSLCVKHAWFSSVSPKCYNNQLARGVPRAHCEQLR